LVKLQVHFLCLKCLKTDPDPGGPKTYGSGSEYATLVKDIPLSLSRFIVQVGFGGAGMYLVGVGLESGEIHVMSWLAASRQFQVVRVLDREQAHHATVTRLAFRYVPSLADSPSSGSLDLHQCAADFSLLNLPKGKSLGCSKTATSSYAQAPQHTVWDDFYYIQALLNCLL
jgi:hypothetical protein